MSIHSIPRPVTGRARPLIFSDLDAALISHLARVRHATASDLAIAFGRPRGTVADRLTVLGREQLVAHDRPSAAPGAWRPTGPGLRTAAIAGRAPRPLRPAAYPHAIAIGCLSGALHAAGLPHLTDYQLRRQIAAGAESGRPLATPPATDGIRRIPEVGPVGRVLVRSVSMTETWLSPASWTTCGPSCRRWRSPALARGRPRPSARRSGSATPCTRDRPTEVSGSNVVPDEGGHR